jgi:NitT/TauT family transport system substrate-binding protein
MKRAIVILVGVVTALTSCAGSSVGTPSSSPSAASPKQTVKIGYNSGAQYSPFYVAQEKGYFQAEGIDAQIEPLTTGSDALAMAASGQLDAYTGGPGVAFFNSAARGSGVKLVNSMARTPATGYTGAVMVRKDLWDSGEVRALSALKGHRIAVAGGTAGPAAYLLTVLLRQSGVDLKDVELTNLTNPDMVAAFKNKAVDAAHIPAPFTTEILREGTGEILSPGGPVGSAITGMLYSERFMQRPSAARSLMVALVKAGRDMRGPGYKSEENLAILNKYTKVPVETLRTMDPYDLDANLAPDADTVVDMQQTYMQQGLLNYAQPLPLSQLVDSSFSDFAAQKLGPLH